MITRKFIAAHVAEFKGKQEVVDFIWDRLCWGASISSAVVEAMEEFELVKVGEILRPIRPSFSDGRIAG